MKKLADIVLKWRLLILVSMLVVTVFFSYQIIANLNVSTIFANLLPQDHEYIKIHNEFESRFGGANLLIIMLKVKDGDIFNADTLKKVKYIDEGVTQIPGVDRMKVLSIGSYKLKKTKVTAWGIETKPLMYPDVPQNEEEMKELKHAIFSNESYFGRYVSHDRKKTLIFADFFEDEMDYSVVYDRLTKIREETEDENTKVCIVGNPMHLGVVAHMTSNMNYIMGATLLIIPILLFACYRSIWGVVAVIAAPLIALIWGLGFMALLGYNLDPLVFVIPFLIALMAFRHSHQLYNRFYEEYMNHRDTMKGCKTIIEEMFLPGITSVMTDALGIMIVGVVPIALLRNISVGCAFSSFATVLIGIILTPILISYIPTSPKFIAHIEKERRIDEQGIGWANHFAKWLGNFVINRGRYVVLIITVVIVGFSYFWAERIIVGDAQVGSNLLWPNSRYNRDSVEINRNLPLINPLFITVNGKTRGDLHGTKVLPDIERFANYMREHSGAVGVQTLCEPFKNVGQIQNNDDPKWRSLPEGEHETNAFFGLVTSEADPGDIDKYVDHADRYSNIVIYFKDKMGPTIEKAMETAKTYIKEHADTDENVSYRLAGGVIGVEAAINEVVAWNQVKTLLLAILGVFICCSLNFRSIGAGFILTVPLLFSNYMAFAYMALNDIGLNIATLPVSAVGIGIGVDYGIYLMARCAEEKRRDPAISLETAIQRTISTYGKSVIYIAGTLIAGLLIWPISALKFQAQMGQLLAIILFFNALGAIFTVPVMILLIKPKFLNRPAQSDGVSKKSGE